MNSDREEDASELCAPRIREGLTLLIIFTITFAALQQGRAATINVGCSANDLIAAIDAANDEGTNPGPDILELTAPCSYTLTAAHNFSDNGLPVITSVITINGNGAIIERVAGSPRFRILQVAPTNGNLTLNDLRLQGGHTPDASGDHAPSGGAIHNNGTLSVNDSTISGNKTGASTGGKGGFGAAIYNSISGSGTLTGVVLENNEAGAGDEHGGPGGAIANEGGPFDIVRCTIDSNVAGPSGNDGGQGEAFSTTAP